MVSRQEWTRHDGVLARCALVALAFGASATSGGNHARDGGGLPVTAATATASCGAPSPSLARLGSRYLDPDEAASMAIGSLSPLAPLIADRRDPRRAKALRLARLIERLHGTTFDGGHGVRTRCHGLGERLREITWRFDLEQIEHVGTLDGRALLTAFESRHTVLVDLRDDRRVDDTLSAEVIDLPPAGAWRASEDGSSLRANRRFRRAGAASATCALTRPAASVAPRCSPVTEIDTTARALNGSIVLEQVFYVDGLLSERVVWRLDA